MSPPAQKSKNLRDRASEGLIAPSILSADFSRLGVEIEEVVAAGADWIHVDVMDGYFVPNITIGPVVVGAIRPFTSLPLDCHLMVSDPEKWVKGFAEAGADLITVHHEVLKDALPLLKKIKGLGCSAGISINPGTPVEAIEPLLNEVDLILVMSVHPGFGGQSFIPESLEKVRKLVSMRGDRKFLIEIDGGVGVSNMAEIRASGVDVFVAGSAVFGQADRRVALKNLRKCLKA